MICVEIRKIKQEEMKDALDLVWEVFLEFEAPDYTEDGVEEFKRCIDNDDWVNARDFYGALESGKIRGVIATKDGTHIALLFVDGAYHRQGIGRKLYDKVEALNDKGFFTVNSSPYAHRIYERWGFADTDAEQCINGLRFYPMKKVLK